MEGRPWRIVLQQAAGHFADWLSINQGGKNESIWCAPCLDSNTRRQMAVFPPKIKLSIRRDWQNDGLIFSWLLLGDSEMWGWRASLVKGWWWPEPLKRCLLLFFHAGSVPTHYNKHCLEQLFQLSTCPACSLEGRPSTKPEADYAPHSTYVLRNCALESNYQCHCSALRTRCEGGSLAGLLLHIFMWQTVIRLEVKLCSRFVALRSDPALPSCSLFCRI